MRVRSHFKSYSMEQGLSEWIQPLVDKRVLGLKSLAEFQAAAVREKVEKYVELGIHPWSRHHAKPQGVANAAAPLALVLVAVAAVAGLSRLHPSSVGMALLAPPEQLLAPLETWNLARFYADHFLLIDFFLYLAVFSSLAHASLGRTFQHRGLAVSLGVMLAVALAASEFTLGFSVRSLGPYAGVLLLVLLGIAGYHGAKSLSMDGMTAAAISIILVGVAVFTYLPATPFHPWVGLLIPVAFTAAVYRFAAQHRLHKEPLAQVNLADGTELLPGITEEKRVARVYLDRVTRQARKDAEQVVRELAYLMRLLDSFSRPEIQALIARKLAEVAPRTHQVRARLMELRNTIAGLQAFNKRVVGNLSDKYAKLTPQCRREVRRILDVMLREQDVADKLADYEDKALDHELGLEQDLQQAASAIARSESDKAKQSIVRAIDREQKAVELLAEMESLESSLVAIAEQALEAHAKVEAGG
ncbi:MAG: hypothetical protein IT462_11550 [Planctomycetes bacterium]|nr:hypothetical protein [Planctomycetota bacterium]